MKEWMIVFVAIVLGSSAAMMEAYFTANPKMGIERSYRKNCLNGVVYLESKYDGYITPLIDQNNKPITCRVENK